MAVPFSLKVPRAARTLLVEPAPAGRRYCVSCLAPAAAGQEWCLECGSPVPGRLRRLGGVIPWPAALGAAILLLAGGAAYLALSPGSSPATPRTPPGKVAAAAATPSPAAVPVAPAIARATPSPSPAPAPAAATAPATAAKAPAVGKTTTISPARSAAPATTTGAARTTPTQPSTTATSGTVASAVLLDADAASTYNPGGLPVASFDAPAKAIDGNDGTAWTYQLDPAAAGRALAGLAVDLKAPQAVRAISLLTTSPGMAVQIYGATGAAPASIADPGWLPLAADAKLGISTTLTLTTRGRLLRHLLVWITRAPAGTTAGSVGIAELRVTR